MNFEGIDQKILAVQAPKPDMYSGFWQLVVDQNVSLIVMITKLVENQKRKAHQYWPEDQDPAMELEHGIKVAFEEEEELDGIYKRKFTVTAKGDIINQRSHFILFAIGKKRTIEQLHCISWPDMEAPKDTKTLLDLFDCTEEILLDNPGTILVHCSAGVGRTGSFIGLYKLIHDYNNKAR